MTFMALGQPIGLEGEEMIKQWNQCPNLKWLGGLPRRQAKAVLSQAGVLVFPSEREGLSLAMIEAVALGVPIVCQPKSSMPELVQHGVNGSLVDASDIAGWVEAIKSWLGPRTEEQQNHLNACREAALEKFDWKNVGRAYGPIYRSVMERKPTVYRVNA